MLASWVLGMHRMLIAKILCITAPIYAYWSNAMFKYDTFRSIFRAEMWQKNNLKCCRIFGFDFLSYQFISYALSLGRPGIRLDGTVMHEKL